MRRMQVMLAAVLVVIGLVGTIGPAGATNDPTLLAKAGFGPPDAQPRTDGKTVVWQELENGQAGYVRDIKAADLSTRQVSTIASFPMGDGVERPDVSGDMIVWSQAGNIVGYDQSTGQQIDIATTDAMETAPSISQHQVVWLSHSGDHWAIMGRDLATMSAAVTLAEQTVTTPSGPYPTPNFRMGAPLISGPRVVWLESTMYDTRVQQTYDWEYFSCDIADCTPQVVAEERGTSHADLPAYSDLYGYLVVYVSTSQVVALDLAHNTRTVLASGPGSFDSATTDGRYVFWSHNQLGDPSARCACADLWGYDLQTGSRFSVLTDDGVNLNPYARGGVLVWSHGSGAPEIHEIPVTATLPNAPQPNPGTTSNDWFYFSETQHYLSFGFKDFWVQSGGVPVFGFPLTEEFSELNPDSGQMLTVQYLERQRFEYHPEHAGTPYEVELGRLGAQDAQQRNLLSTLPFQPLTTRPTGYGCQYFAATSHSVCSAFPKYWSSHGLEFGDSGVSYRESLALFGYPISEAYVDPQTGLLTQYFERAVFEYHPENADPYKVLLRRLGAEQMTARGW